jgi:hypothetical protein
MTDVVEHSDVPYIAREPSMFIRDVLWSCWNHIGMS